MKTLIISLLIVLITVQVVNAGNTIGFANSDGSYDSVDMETGQVTWGFSSPDGSQDSVNMTTGEATWGFANSDGSQDAYVVVPGQKAPPASRR